MPTIQQFKTVYPAIYFGGWQCGESFIPQKSKCYTDPTTGRKLKNPINYKQYRKKRVQAIKRQKTGSSLNAEDKIYAQSVARDIQREQKKKIETAAKSVGATKVLPGGIASIDPNKIEVDPKRFQYKLSGSNTKSGTVGSLRGVKKWDSNLAGIIQVWADPKDKKVYVINGHNRLELEKKLAVKQRPARFLDAKSAKEARAIGALTNIAEGRGNARDAAKFFRDSNINKADLEKRGIPLREKIATDGLALSKLSDGLFNQLIQGQLPESRAVAIGDKLSDHTQQEALVKLIAREEKRGRRITNDVVGELADMTSTAPKKQEGANLLTLLGYDPEERSLAVEKADISASIKRQLNKDKKLFSTVGKGKAASDLKRGGNKINVEESAAIAQNASTTLTLFDKQKYQTGKIDTILNKSAERLANGEKREKITKEARQEIQSYLQQTFKYGEGKRNRTGKNDFNRRQVSSISYFAKKCGKGYISDKETCYTNKSGKTDYVYKINPKTGRRNKVKKKVVTRKKRKPTLGNRIKKSLSNPSKFLERLKDNIQNIWDDVGEFLYNDNDRSKLRKPNRSSSSKPFRKPDIKTARPELVKKAIAKKPPAKVPEYLAKNLNENQKQEVGMAINAMNQDGGFLLANGTGTGKTRTQLATAQMMADEEKKVFIISKSEVLKPKWNGKNKGVTGSFKDDAATMGIKTKLTKTGVEVKKGEIGLSTYSNLDKLKRAVDKDTVLIFDEAHSFKNADSARSKHGMEMMDQAHSVLYATATPADKPGHLDYLSRANVFNGNSKKEIYNWLGLESYSVKKGDSYIQRYRIGKSTKPEDVVNRLNGLFDQMTENGNTIKREISLKDVEIGFAEINVNRETRKKQRAIAQAYKNSPSPLAKSQMLMHQRRQLETDKVPATVELVEDAIARGRKPIIFVSRVNESTVMAGKNQDIEIKSEGTAKLLKKELEKKGIKNISEIHGGTKKKSAEEMDKFQSGKNEVVIATIESGGTGINLDDRDGDKPRSLIIVTPPFSAVENVQAAGRVWRLKTKSTPEIDYIFTNTKVDNWNRGIISNKMESLGAIVSGETGKLSVDDKKMISKLSNTNKSPRPPKPKSKRKRKKQ